MSGCPFVSVIIPVWNAAASIERCLRAVELLDYPNDRHEVIVVDNGSTDATCDVVRRFPFATLLSEPIAGSYRARNLGLRHAKGEYVAFTDSDCVPGRAWLSAAMTAAAREPDAAILAGPIELFRTSGRGSSVAETYERLFSFDQRANVASGMCVTANWVSPRALLLALGGFDPALPSGGDAACARRVRAAGHRIAYVPEMVVGHPIRASIRELIGKRRRIIGGRILAERDVRPPHTWFRTYVLIAGAQIKRAMRAPRLGTLDRLKLVTLIALLWAVSMAEVRRIGAGGMPRRA